MQVSICSIQTHTKGRLAKKELLGIVFLAYSPQIARPAKTGACASSTYVFQTAYHYSASSGISRLQGQTPHKWKKTQGENSVRELVPSRTMLHLSKLKALMV